MTTRTTAARQAAGLFAICGLLAVLSLPVPGSDRLALALVGLVDLSVAAAALLLPWERWSQRATLALGVPGFAVITLSNAAGLLPPRALSIMYVLVFVWVGSHHRRWQSLWLLPPMVVSYVGAVLLRDHGIPLSGRAVVMVTLVSVLVAETVARSQERVRASEAEMRFLVEHSNELVSRVSADGVVRFTSPSCERVLGWRPEEVIGMRTLALRHPDDPDPAALALATPGQPVAVVRRMRRADGAWTWLESVAQAVPGPDGELEVLISARDVTERRKAEQRLAHVATHDGLTGVANRALLEARLAAATERGTPVTVAFIDLDGFKAVNDRHGHAVGDQLLVQVARRLEGTTRETDTVARHGGDEFVVLVDGTVDQPALARRVEGVLSRPYDVEGVQVRIGASVGTTVVRPGAGVEELLAEADRRMYGVKAARRSAPAVPAPRPELSLHR